MWCAGKYIYENQSIGDETMANNNNEIYLGYNNQFKSQKKLLEKETFSERNKELIRDYQNHLFAKGCTQSRVAKATWVLRKLCKMFKKDLDCTNKKDFESIVSQIELSDYSCNTKSDYKKGLKQFYGWFEEEDSRIEGEDLTAQKDALKGYKYLKKHVKTTVPPAPINPGAIIKPETIETVLKKGCKTDMERAFISTLHASGCRVGELLGLKRKDILKEAGMWILRVDGKTGERVIPIRTAVPHLAVWLNNHPDNSSDAFVWISRHNRWKGQRIRYTGARALIKRCFDDAGFKNSKMNPHWFRHSRCTLNAKKFNDAICCQIAGHSPETMKRYRHISGDDVINAFKKEYGLGTEPESDKEAEPFDCEMCGTINEPKARYCVKCGKPTSVRVAFKDEEAKTDAINEAMVMLGKIMSNPEQKDAFEKFCKEQKSSS